MKQKRQLSLDSNIKLPTYRSTMAQCHELGQCSTESRAAVTEEARFVLEQFLKRSFSQNDVSPIRQQYRQLTHEVIPEETHKDEDSSAFLAVPSTKLQKRSVTPDYMRSDSYRAAAAQGTINIDLTNEKSQTLPSSYKSAIRGQSKDSLSPSGVSEKDTLGSLHSSGHSPGKPSQHSPISYSTGDDSCSDAYDQPDSSGMNRKKKTFFKRASERLRQSFRIQHRDHDRCKDGEDLHVDEKKKKKRKKKSSTMDSISQKSRLSVDTKSPDSVYEIHMDAHLHGDVSKKGTDGQLSVHSEQDNMGTLSPGSAHGHSKKQKISPEEDKPTHDKSAWDRLLQHIRKKGKNMRKKLKREDSFGRRSKSAEPLHTTPSPPPTSGSVRESKEDEDIVTCDVQITSSPEHDEYREKLQEVIDTWKGAHKMREGLRLEGLSAHRPAQYEAQTGSGYDEVDECLTAVRSQTDDWKHEVRSRGASHQPIMRPAQYRRLPSSVEADNVDEPDNAVPDSRSIIRRASGRSIGKPFHECSDNEKEELFEKVAQKLATIADNYNSTAGSPLESSVSDAEPESGPTVTVVRVGSLEKKIAACLRSRGDVFSESQPLAAEAIGDALKDAGYNKFKEVVSREIGNEPGVQQLAALFHITKSAVQLAGAGGTFAVQVKENALRYFEDKFASWIVGQGGWESMIDETDLESEVD